MRTLNLTDERMDAFLKIKAGRPQDVTRDQTFEHILKVYDLYMNSKSAREERDLAPTRNNLVSTIVGDR